MGKKDKIPTTVHTCAGCGTTETTADYWSGSDWHEGFFPTTPKGWDSREYTLDPKEYCAECKTMYPEDPLGPVEPAITSLEQLMKEIGRDGSLDVVRWADDWECDVICEGDWEEVFDLAFQIGRAQGIKECRGVTYTRAEKTLAMKALDACARTVMANRFHSRREEDTERAMNALRDKILGDTYGEATK